MGTASAAPADRAFAAWTAALTVLFLAVSAVWAVFTPWFHGPDEPLHVSSILRVAAGEGWPAPGKAPVDASVMTAAREARLIHDDAGTFDPPDRITLEPLSSEHPVHADMPVLPQPDRSALGGVEERAPIATMHDQMTQHPPLYYLGGAAVVRILDLADVPWDRALLTLRLYTVALLTPLVPALVLTARRLGAPPAWALLFGTVAVGLPQVTSIGAVVSNDALAFSLGALAAAVLVRVALAPLGPASVVLAGVAVGAALWTKGTLLAFGLPLLLVFLWRPGVAWRRRLAAALGAGVISQVVCPWWLLNLVRYGALQPDGYVRTPRADWDPAQADVGHFVTVVTGRFVQSVVGHFGWMDVPLPVEVAWVVVAALLALTAAGLVVLARRRGDDSDGARRLGAAVALLLALVGITVVIARQSWLVYAQTGHLAGVQGRYLLPLLAALAPAALGAAALARDVPPHGTGRASRAPRGVLALAAGAGAGLNAYSLGLVLRAAHPGAPIDLAHLAAAVGLGSGWILLTFAGFGLALLGIAALPAVARQDPATGTARTSRTEERA